MHRNKWAAIVFKIRTCMKAWMHFEWPNNLHMSRVKGGSWNCIFNDPPYLLWVKCWMWTRANESFFLLPIYTRHCVWNTNTHAHTPLMAPLQHGPWGGSLHDTNTTFDEGSSGLIRLTAYTQESLLRGIKVEYRNGNSLIHGKDTGTPTVVSWLSVILASNINIVICCW